MLIYHYCAIVISAFSAPDFDIRDVTESSFNVTWAAPPQWGVHIVHYIEWRKTGLLYRLFQGFLAALSKNLLPLFQNPVDLMILESFDCKEPLIRFVINICWKMLLDIRVTTWYCDTPLSCN